MNEWHVENESSVVCVCGVTNLLKVSYCLIISSLLLYQLQVNIIQPIPFSFLICTPFLQLYAWFYVMGGREKHWRCVITCHSLHPPSSSPPWCHQESAPPAAERASCSALSSWHYRGGKEKIQGSCRVRRGPWIPVSTDGMCSLIAPISQGVPKWSEMVTHSSHVWKSYMSNFSCMLFRIPT